MLNWNVAVSSSLPSGAIDSINAAFNVTDQRQAALPVAVFLIGYVFGPILFGPISEQFGRKTCFVLSFTIYTAFTLACALAPNWPALLVFRAFVCIGAAAPQTVIGAMYADVYPNLQHRGRAVTALGLTSNVGPLVGPIIAGFSSTTDWRWMFWISLITAGISWPLLVMLPGEPNPGDVLAAEALIAKRVCYRNVCACDPLSSEQIQGIKRTDP